MYALVHVGQTKLKRLIIHTGYEIGSEAPEIRAVSLRMALFTYVYYSTLLRAIFAFCWEVAEANHASIKLGQYRLGNFYLCLTMSPVPGFHLEVFVMLRIRLAKSILLAWRN